MSEQVLDKPNMAEQAQLYRQVSDEMSVGYRRAGVIDAGETAALFVDPATTFADTSYGVLPAFTPIEHAVGAGYDVDRSYRLINEAGKSEGVFYFCLPPIGEGEIFNADVPKVNEGFIFVDHAAQDMSTSLFITSLLKNNGFTVEEIPIEDDQAADGNKQASISLYGFHNPTADYDKQVTLREVATDYIDSLRNEDEEFTKKKEGANLYKGDELEEELIESLWSLYQSRFQWLGEKHPISMEDTKEEFVGLITSPDTVASIYTVDGQPTCFQYFTDNLSNVYWLNEAFTAGPAMGLNAGEKLLHLPGVVAKAENVFNYAEPVMQLAAMMIASTNAPFMTCFENTNRSEVYIPNLVKKYIDGTGNIVELATLIDRQIYRCFKFTKQLAE